jgi:hypothetical protein
MRTNSCLESLKERDNSENLDDNIKMDPREKGLESVD